jgi:hypothetical protein
VGLHDLALGGGAVGPSVSFAERDASRRELGAVERAVDGIVQFRTQPLFVLLSLSSLHQVKSPGLTLMLET